MLEKYLRSAYFDLKFELQPRRRGFIAAVRLLLLFGAMASSPAWAGNHGAEYPFSGATFWTNNCQSCHGGQANDSSFSTTPGGAGPHHTMGYYADNPANIATGINDPSITSAHMAILSADQVLLSAYFAALLTPVIQHNLPSTIASGAAYSGNILPVTGQDYLVSGTGFDYEPADAAAVTAIGAFVGSGPGNVGVVSGTAPVVTTPTTYTIRLRARNFSASPQYGSTTWTVTVQPYSQTFAGNATLQTELNTPKTLDMTAYLSGVSITGVSVIAQPAHGSVRSSGTRLTYTPDKDFFGSDSFTYQGYGAGSTGGVGTVTVTVNGRTDPTQDARVTGMVKVEAATIRRFAMAQLFNFQQRIESRHHAVSTSPTRAVPANVPVPTPSQVPVGGGGGAQKRGYFTSWQPDTVLAYANDPNMMLNSPGASQNEQGAVSDSLYGMLMNAAAGALTSSTLNLTTISTAVGSPADDGLNRIEVWVAGNLRFGALAQSGLDSRFTTDGVSIGADKRIDRKLTLGMGVGYARDHSSIGSDGTASNASGNSVAGYASYQMDAGTFLDGLLGFGKVKFNTNRFVPIANDFARASRSGDQVFGSLSYGYEYRKDGLLWSPYGRYDFSLDRLNQGAESGAGSNALSYSSQRQRSSHLSLGMRAQAVHRVEFGVVQPHARIEYQRGLESSGNTTIAYADLLDTQYAIAGTSQSANSFVLGLGSDFVVSDTLRLALDYQRLSSGKAESYQSINLHLTKTIKGKNDLASLLGESYTSYTTRPSGLSVTSGFAFDSNVSRASEAADIHSDTIYSLTVNQAKSIPVTLNSRLGVSGFMDVEKFRIYTGLGRASLGAQGSYTYRFSGDFSSPTIAAFARYTVDEYESVLRDGSRRSFGMTVRESLTDRVDLFAAASKNIRSAKCVVFDTRDVSGRVNLDYRLADTMTLYLTGEMRKGDIVSSGQPTLTILDMSTVFVRDDVFGSPQLYDYRMKGKTNILTLGYNLAFGSKDSMDMSLRRVTSTPDVILASPMQYIDNQYTISYLLAF
jgi:uncharacterized protein YhjY with autotransporter beta-barrel domain/mono/diheme cytochrome c family protein